MATTATAKPQLIQFHITPNKKPVEKLVGTVNSKTGEFRGNKSHKSLRYPPKQFIPFTYTAYVKKLYEKDGKINEKEEGVYNGKIKFLDINEAGGEHMELRYLANCPSLDRQYQEKNGYKASNETDGVGDFFLGARIYDVPVLPTNELYRTFMANHPNNGDNPNRPQRLPIYFKIRNGKADVEARKARLKYEKVISDFQYKMGEDDNLVEIYSIIYNINPSLELNSRRDNIMQKFDIPKGAETVMGRGKQYFIDLKNKVQFYLDKKILVVSDGKMIFNSDKKSLNINIELGADPEKFAENFINGCNDDYKQLKKWNEVEKTLTKNN